MMAQAPQLILYPAPNRSLPSLRIAHTSRKRATATYASEQSSRANTPPAGSPGLASFSGSAGCVTFRSVSNDQGAQLPSQASPPSEHESRVPQSKLGELTGKLRSLGLAGVVAYGLLNTLYYTASFLLVWTLVAKVPQGLGAAAAVRSFLAVFATVWAGSQVTKVARAAGALFLAPFVDKAMEILCSKLKLKSKQQAFLIIVGSCIGLALAIFGVVVAAWA
ncbi:hypothetical protein DUNSADRAFT_6254 [Dunaliella salina]|uniref:Uncharacterized protein n=1 Tax=Dunaliella salina TaxID=3046 RepID=A0ABQ7GNS8_DUNSA|nr:hypothetical protein DUNSADRAFT_6254 [Dunaliella salina]|eukprot:KAF5836242.1 hypothetical protein DUNSADRAFT_6254 [Dunaliella salina]